VGPSRLFRKSRKGTTAIFTVSLACKTAPCSTPAVEISGFNFPTTVSNDVQDQSRRGSRLELASPPDKIVLIAEDNPIMQRVTLNSLRKLGYRAEAVWNGQEALEYIIEHQNVGLVLMGCQMPLLDGYEATRQIRSGRAYTQFSDLPIIALTASAIKGDREACQEAGMNEYLTKPIHKQSLKEMLAHWFPS
jgi:CheY-like chemotaxis protein